MAARDVWSAGPLRDALEAISSELLAAEETGLDIQIAIGGLIAGLEGRRLRVGAELQQIDRLTQVLKDLSVFAAVLAQMVPAGLTVDIDGATRDLKLRDVAARLRGEAPEDIDEEDAFFDADPIPRRNAG